MSYDYLNNLEHYIVTQNKTHKHKRAEKVYVPEECNEEQYEYYDDCDGFDDNFEIICGQTLSYNDWLDEIGSPQYANNFNWVNELIESGYFDEDITPFVNNIVIKG